IRLHRHAFCTPFLQQTQSLLRRRLVRTISDSHPRPILRKLHSNPAPNPATPASNQSHPILQPHYAPQTLNLGTNGPLFTRRGPGTPCPSSFPLATAHAEKKFSISQPAALRHFEGAVKERT